MELSHLRAFERAARTGSFTHAAADLDLTQPSVSARIATLEKELGGPLFERGGRQLRLTSLGRAFLPHAERALAAIHDGQAAVDRFLTGRSGLVAVATYPSWALYLLADVVERFREEYPAVDIGVAGRLNDDIIAWLYEGRGNLGMLGPPLWDSGMEIHARFQELIRPYVAANHPLAHRYTQTGSLHMADIYEHTLYRVSYGPHINALMNDLVEKARRGSGGASVYLPVTLAIRSVIKAQGVAFFPESHIEYHVRQGKLVRLDVKDLPVFYSEPMIVSLKGRTLDAPAQAFIQMTRSRWHHLLIE